MIVFEPCSRIPFKIFPFELSSALSLLDLQDKIYAPFRHQMHVFPHPRRHASSPIFARIKRGFASGLSPSDRLSPLVRCHLRTMMVQLFNHLLDLGFFCSILIPASILSLSSSHHTHAASDIYPASQPLVDYFFLFSDASSSLPPLLPYGVVFFSFLFRFRPESVLVIMYMIDEVSPSRPPSDLWLISLCNCTPLNYILSGFSCLCPVLAAKLPNWEAVVWHRLWNQIDISGKCTGSSSPLRREHTHL